MIQLSDIDGSIPGRAVLVVLLLEDPDKPPQRIDFIEVENVSPLNLARNMQKRITAELIGTTVLITANPRARYLEWKMAAEGWGHNLLTPTHYLATRPRNGEIS